jgi:hypothetical protein
VIYKSTSQVAELLQTAVTRIEAAIRARKLAAPARLPGGAFGWLPDDVERARAAIAIDYRRKEHRGLKAAFAR